MEWLFIVLMALGMILIFRLVIKEIKATANDFSYMFTKLFGKKEKDVVEDEDEYL